MMANRQPVEPDWRRPWQQELSAHRHIEKTMISGATNVVESGVTAQQRRRLQRIELIKTIVFGIGLLIAIFVLLFVFGLLFNH